MNEDKAIEALQAEVDRIREEGPGVPSPSAVWRPLNDPLEDIPDDGIVVDCETREEVNDLISIGGRQLDHLSVHLCKEDARFLGQLAGWFDVNENRTRVMSCRLFWRTREEALAASVVADGSEPELDEPTGFWHVDFGPHDVRDQVEGFVTGVIGFIEPPS